MLDEFRSTLITWDKATSRIYSPVTANESDENGRKLVVQIVNGGQVEDLTGATLHLYWETRDKAHDGLDVFKSVDLEKGEFELSYTTGMLSNKGALNANLVLIDTVGRVVSERFKITVTEGIDNDAIQSENSFSSLTQALIDISNLEQNYAPRLNDLTAQLQQTEQSLNAQLARKANQLALNATNNELTNKTSKQYVDSLIAQLGSLQPKGAYASLSGLQSAYPTGDTGVYVVQDTGILYAYMDGSWTNITQYQTAIADASNVEVKSNELASSNVSDALLELKNSVSEDVFKAYSADKSVIELNSQNDNVDIPYNALDTSFLDFEITNDGTIANKINLSGYIIRGKNLFNVANALTNKYINETTGGELTAANHKASTYIEVKAGDVVTFGSKEGIKFARMVFFNINKVYNKGYFINIFTEKMTYTATQDGFVRISADTTVSSADTWQIEIGENLTEYADYVDPQIVTFKEVVQLKGIANMAKDTLKANGQLTSQIGNVLLNGLENWYEGSHGTNIYVFFITGWSATNKALVGTANSGVATSNDGNYPIGTSDGTTGGINLNANGNLTVFIEKVKVDLMTGANPLAKFKAYLTSYPIDFIFKKTVTTTKQLPINYPVVRVGGQFELLVDVVPTVKYKVLTEKKDNRKLLVNEDLQLEKAGTIHAGGFKYTSFGGGAMVDGKEVYVQRTAPKHTTVNGEYGNVIAYIKDKYGNWTTKILDLGVTGGELRDVNLSLPYDGTSDVILSATKYAGVAYEYTNWIFRLDKDLNLKYKEEMLGTEGLFVWGNVLFTPQGRTLKGAYDQDFSANSNRGVFLCRRESDSNNYTLIELFPPSAVNPNEINIGYWGNKLVAICRQRADYSLYRETTDLEGLTGWSEPRKLKFKAHAPQIPCYTPTDEPLIITFSSVTDELVSQEERFHRDVSISATYNGIDWHPEIILVENNHYGGYTSFVPNGYNRYGMVYYDDYDTAESNYKEGTDLFYKEVQIERVLTELPNLRWHYKRSV